MKETLVFKIFFLSLFFLVLIVRAYFGIKQRLTGQSSWSVSKEAVAREGRLSLILRPMMFLLMLSLVVLYIIEPSCSGGLFLPIPSIIRYGGVLLGIMSILLLIWVHRTLGLQWSTTLQFMEGHALITSGPYQYIRHPMYAALSLFFISLSIVSSFLPFFVLVVLTILFFVRIVEREDLMMIEQFGEEYREYMKATGRFLPRL
ncbi:MAG: isoprenylcysteine carboxylmethyltransferase family protein [Anaerolineales bacterium]|nr:isoprenylcysteine carboxylmethyltransferase family protein [Anaerolineales bacterium]